jgi:tyrosinase
MRLSFSLLALACAATQLVSAAPQRPAPSLAPALPLSAFNTSWVQPLSPEEIQRLSRQKQGPEPEAPAFSIAATCGNPRTRIEWDNASTAQRTNYVNAIRCLLNRPASGQFSQSRNRYEDLVALHQNLTPNVHGNHKFLVWHRYYLWVFEDMLRAECGYNAGLLWFDESRYAGRFSQSSIFSSQYFGGIALGGNCVRDGVSYLTPSGILSASRTTMLMGTPGVCRSHS